MSLFSRMQLALLINSHLSQIRASVVTVPVGVMRLLIPDVCSRFLFLFSFSTAEIHLH